MLFAGFPKLLACHFSEKWRTVFPYFPGMSGQDLYRHPSAITIIGGDIDSHKEILQWMLNASDGYGIKPWGEYRFSQKPFHRYYHLRRSAQIIGCFFLETEFHMRMQALSNRRIHSDDVAAVYREVGPDSEMARHLVKHVASFFMQKGSNQPVGPYVRLRNQIPALDAAVVAHIGYTYARDPGLARAWNERKLANEEAVSGNSFLEMSRKKLEEVKKLGDDAEEAEKVKGEDGGEEGVTEKTEQEKGGVKKEGEAKDEEGVVGVDSAVQARKRDKNARRREKKRLAKSRAAAAAAVAGDGDEE